MPDWRPIFDQHGCLIGSISETYMPDRRPTYMITDQKSYIILTGISIKHKKNILNMRLNSNWTAQDCASPQKTIQTTKKKSEGKKPKFKYNNLPLAENLYFKRL